MYRKNQYLCSPLDNKPIIKGQGEVAEWSIAAVLKTVELRGSGGSNPSLSAKTKKASPKGKSKKQEIAQACLKAIFFFYF